eukprot:755841_1
MAEELEKTKQYKYQSNANLVIQRLDSGISRESGPTGESSTLSTFDQSLLRDNMGIRSAYGRPTDRIEKAKQKHKEKEKDEVDGNRQRHKTMMEIEHTESVLDAEVDTTYKPTTTESIASYELMIKLIETKFGPQRTAVMHSIAHEIISIIKNDKFTASQSKINELNKQFSDYTTFGKNDLDYLHKCCRRINDFGLSGMDPDEKAARENNRVVPIKSFEEEDESGFYADMIGEDDDSGDDRIEPNVEDPATKQREEARKKNSNKKLKSHTNMMDIAVENEANTVNNHTVNGEDDVDMVDVRKKREVEPKEVDAYWLQRAIKENFPSKQDTAKQIADQLLNILEMEDKRALENQVSDLLGFSNWEFTKKMLRNKDIIVWCTKLKRAQDEKERQKIETQMSSNHVLCKILEDLQATYGTTQKKIKKFREKAYEEAVQIRKNQEIQEKKQKEDKQMAETNGNTINSNVSYDLREWNLKHNKMKLDLESLAFREGGHFNSSTQWKLRKGSTYLNKKGYQEIFVPHIATPPKQNKTIPITELPKWTQKAFLYHGDEEEEDEDSDDEDMEQTQNDKKTQRFAVTHLNNIQSACYKTALLTSENVLLSAPTGAGKTNVAMLCILRELGIHLNADNETVRSDEFKIVYIAPMKSLVREIVLKFSKRLAAYDVNVAELSGDQQLSREQIASTTVIVTTPEKWDIITRKGMDRSYASLVKLIIMDEIHLLHDLRGAVLESIICRTIRTIEKTQNLIRLVGLSATMPNYMDIAELLRVKLDRGLFVFGASYRPIPLISRFAGVTLKKPFKQYQLMNDLCYEYVSEQLGDEQQCIIFVHSRKETAKTAQMLLDKFKKDGADREILMEEVEDAERVLVEDLFKARVLKVLVLIIKGTQIYNAQYGEAYLITTHKELKYYMPLLNDQLPIESQLVHKLPDALNAEIVLGSISSIRDAVEWLSYSYLNIRMRKAPHVYQLDNGESDTIKQRQIDLVHTALLELNKSGLCVYDERTGVIDCTDLGRVASYYYISYSTMREYAEYLSISIINDIEIFKIFSLSLEFKYVSVREGEKGELLKLMDRVPIPIKESIGDKHSGSAKINVLLQAYISRLKLDGFALKSDMCYVQQSAQRLMRALFEISLKRKWAYVAYRCLTICKMILNKQWSIESPLRQFGINNPHNKLTYSIINRIEKCQFSFDRFLYLSPAEIGELIRMPSVGKDIYKLIHCIPKLLVKGQIQPLTPTIIRIQLTIDIDFDWNESYHGTSQEFWIIVEDVDGEEILHYEFLKVKQNESEYCLSFTIPIASNGSPPPQYFVRIVSDKWLGSTTVLPISFRHLILPRKFKEKTELLDLQPLPVDKDTLYTFNHDYLNSIQTQIYNSLYNTSNNVLLCAPSLSGKTRMAECAIVKMLNEFPNGKCVYLTPKDELCAKQFKDWTRVFDRRSIKICVLEGTTEGTVLKDVKAINQSQIIISTPINYDRVQRGWRKRKAIQNINLFIADKVHFIGVNHASFNGSIYEMVISRQKYIMSALNIPTRMIGLSLSISNASDVAGWLDVSSKFQYNFSPRIRPVRYNIVLKSCDINNFESRHISYIKQCYSFCTWNTSGGIVIFVSSRKHCRRLASDIVALSYASHVSMKPAFLNLDFDQFKKYLHKCKDNIAPNSGLYKCLLNGIGFIHEYTDEATKSDVCKFYKSGAIRVLIVTAPLSYELESFGLKDTPNCTSSVILFGSKYYCGLSANYVDYEVCDMIQMMSYINCSTSASNTAYVLCHSNRESFLRKFLFDSFPIESHLDCANNLEDAVNSEIVTSTISTANEAMDFMTWTFYYFRLTQNPNYYNLRGVEDSDLSQHLSELIEESFHRLYNANCICVDENMDVSPLNNGLIASYYYITYTSIEFFYTALHKLKKKKIKLANILSILSYATEFETKISLRKNEERTIQRIAKHLPITTATETAAITVANKVNVLLQTHFMRLPLKSHEIRRDRRLILSYSIPLLYAMIDIISTSQMLNGVLVSIELCQMIVQSMWDKDNFLLQLPHMTRKTAQYLNDSYQINNIYQILEMEDEERSRAFEECGITNAELNEIAAVCNNYPDLELTYEARSNGDDVTLFVNVERELEEDDEDQNMDKTKIRCEAKAVDCRLYPFNKYEAWFLIVGDPENDKLISIKRFTIKTMLQKFKIKFKRSANQSKKLKLYLMSDSYLGLDQYLDIE